MLSVSKKMKLTKKQRLKEAIATIYEGLAQGQTDKDLIEDMRVEYTSCKEATANTIEFESFMKLLENFSISSFDIL